MTIAFRKTVGLFCFVLLAGLASGQDDKQRRTAQQEEIESYFKKWMTEDVVYIVAPEEKAVFEKLTTPEEKEQFIEQFWFRRDPDLTTSVNEFKEEHYRRIAYANERFASGLPGWMTDRGRIYIIHGPPAEIESHASGGHYQRPIHEGGGSTSTYPFEVWRYRHIDGVGEDIELEFVDPTISGEYRLALRPEEKDALLYVPGAGLTLDEEMGNVSKADRPFFNPGGGYEYMSRGYKDNPFTRYEVYANVQRPKAIRYVDLKQIVDVGISYENLNFALQDDYIRLNDQQVLVPLTIELKNKDMTFELENGVQVARVAVYGIVTSITNRVITEFDDDLVASFQPENLVQGLEGRSLYQKVIPLEGKMRYKLDLVVKDVGSGNMGVVRKALVPPAFGSEKLELSSLIVADHMRFLSEVPKEDQMFVIGDVWIRPKIDRTFRTDQYLNVYVQVHNAALDQVSMQPALTVRYSLTRGQEKAAEEIDREGKSIQYFSGQRVVLARQFNLEDLEAGSYRLDVEIEDSISGQTVSASKNLKLVAGEKPQP